MRYAIVEGDVVVRVEIADCPLRNNWICSEEAEIGDRYAGGAFVRVVHALNDTGTVIASPRYDA
jgi:hypothetical protein